MEEFNQKFTIPRIRSGKLIENEYDNVHITLRRPNNVRLYHNNNILRLGALCRNILLTCTFYVEDNQHLDVEIADFMMVCVLVGCIHLSTRGNICLYDTLNIIRCVYSIYKMDTNIFKTLTM